jgi:hypothetical protein
MGETQKSEGIRMPKGPNGQVLIGGSLRLRHLNYTLKYLDCEAKGLRRAEVGPKWIESLRRRWQRNGRMKYERLSVVPSPNYNH